MVINEKMNYTKANSEIKYQNVNKCKFDLPALFSLTPGSFVNVTLGSSNID